MRASHYAGLAADDSRPDLASDAKKAELIALGESLIKQREDDKLPAIDENHPLAQLEAENQEWWPTHREAIRQGHGDMLTKEHRRDLVYHCGEGPFFGIQQQQQREKCRWAIMAQPGVTMREPIVQIWGEFTHFEWMCLDDATGETIAKGSVCRARRGHRGGGYYKSEQLSFVPDVFASQPLLDRLKV